MHIIFNKEVFKRHLHLYPQRIRELVSKETVVLRRWGTENEYLFLSTELIG